MTLGEFRKMTAMMAPDVEIVLEDNRCDLNGIQVTVLMEDEDDGDWRNWSDLDYFEEKHHGKIKRMYLQ